jgi:anti-sigma B factor antagonist
MPGGHTETWPALVALPAEIDITNALNVRSQIITAINRGVRIVIADMTATTFCDSPGTRALVLAHQWAVGEVPNCGCCGPGSAVRRVLACWAPTRC